MARQDIDEQGEADRKDLNTVNLALHFVMGRRRSFMQQALDTRDPGQKTLLSRSKTGHQARTKHAMTSTQDVSSIRHPLQGCVLIHSSCCDRHHG